MAAFLLTYMHNLCTLCTVICLCLLLCFVHLLSITLQRKVCSLCILYMHIPCVNVALLYSVCCCIHGPSLVWGANTWQAREECEPIGEASPLKLKAVTVTKTVTKSLLEFVNVKQLIGLVTKRHIDPYSSP